MKTNLTPLLQQWYNIKKNYKDSILLFRLGDFYETFYEDAVITSKVLGITLTQRQEGVPLAGIPHHNATPHIAKLTRAGYKVAICEQLEDPIPGKLVKRGVVEVITAGTIVDEELLDRGESNYLLGIVKEKDRYGLSVLDLSTGEFKLTEVNKSEVQEELKRLSPVEIIAKEKYPEVEGFKLTLLDGYHFNYDYALLELTSYFKVSSLDGFGCGDLVLGVRAAGGVLSYIKEVKKKILPHIKPPIPYFLGDYLILDEVTRRNLELTEKIFPPNRKEGTLLSILDHTKTPMGARFLKNAINFPLTNIKEIKTRFKEIEELVVSPKLITRLHQLLHNLPDVERLVAKLSAEKITPRELWTLTIAMKRTVEIATFLSHHLPSFCHTYTFPNLTPLITLIEKALKENPPPQLKEGNIIKDGFNKEIDELREAIKLGRKWISSFEAKERERTHIPSLKVGFNTVFGYYIEVTKPNLKFVPPNYIRKQTLTNAERFITEELKSYEEKILSGEEKLKKLEYAVFCEIRGKVFSFLKQIQFLAHLLARLDFIVSLAYVAYKNEYSKPEIVKDDCIIIKEGRHPVLETLIPKGEFVPNSTFLGKEQRIYIITGPNMSGKSTYLRQVGLIVLMAQMGSFVPAKQAIIGVCDRIFTRIGASDDLSKGVSTFLREMNETANILNTATSRSLVLLDEIGRGTSTFDGMSIAWATVEHILKQNKSKTLFATHYHQLTGLNRISSKIKNYKMGAKREGDTVVFLHKLTPGGCDESYGIDVAKLAGIPSSVITRAKEVLTSLEKLEKRFLKEKDKRRQKTLFEEEKKKQVGIKVVEEIKKINPNHLTPIDGLIFLKKLKDWVNGN